GSLLEVGTGMHPDLTARENVYMNGAILGMRKWEISKHFEEIIDFAGCALYVDTPIKRFSSGMRVRLGFSVAAFLNPEILIVDEVLAVGDAEFQKRALGKMREITGNQGRTLLFVSHNLASIRYLCEKGVLLKDGMIQCNSLVDDVLDAYKAEGQLPDQTVVNRSLLQQSIIDGFRFTDVKIAGKAENGRIISGEEMHIQINYECSKQYSCPAFVIIIKDEYEQEIIRLSNMPISGYEIDELFGKGSVFLKIDRLPLVKGQYYIDLGFVHEKVEWHFRLENIVNLYVEGNDVYNSGIELDRNRGIIWTDHHWLHDETGKNVIN
ncbi:MAG TPA: Wzt carbohydrate-binding domain-containing protein, partial [Gammaproteobacteria bacterium]|nr:Wzt carbohydrate-binding domain-containing protein [Gammaproteobacteria bacterium]